MCPSSPGHVLFVGHRKAGISAAQQAGFQVLVWNPLSHTRKKREGFFRFPFPNSMEEINPELISSLAQYQLKAIIALTEAAVLPAALIREALALPGTHFRQALSCRDKYLMKKTARAQGLKVTKFRLIRDSTPSSSLIQQLGFPMILKQRASSGSRGLKIISNFRELETHRKSNHLAESFIHGRELSTELFIHKGRILFQNFTEYYRHLSINIVPGRISKDELELCRQVSEQVIKTFEIERGMVHLELFLSPEGGVTFGELAVRPPGGYLMHLLKLAYGFDPWRAVLDLELGKPVSFPQQPIKMTAVCVIHPGPGEIHSIEGVDQIKTLPAVHDVKLKRTVGDTVCVRLGSGNDIGRIIFQSNEYSELLQSVDKSGDLLKIKV